MDEALREPVDEVRALARIGFQELSGAAVGLYGFHRAIAGRAFAATGPMSAPVRVVHDAISSRMYEGVGAAFRAVGRAADAGLGRREVADGRTLSRSPRGALVVGALTGLYGDVLERDGSELHEPLAVRVDATPVAPGADALAGAFPMATPKLVVF